jgi:two-component system C4-dicarboxylate transport sensor histidine kinase DctB
MKDSPTKRLKLLIASGHDALLSVADSGSGIQDLDNLFEPFYTTKKPGDGLGLGLAISSSIISDLQGRLSARNRQEGGAVFEIRLPLGGAQTSPDSDKDT